MSEIEVEDLHLEWAADELVCGYISYTDETDVRKYYKVLNGIPVEITKDEYLKRPIVDAMNLSRS
jgi:hypothetical protein